MIELLKIPLRNQPGQLLDIVNIISGAGVDMKALSLTHHGRHDNEVLLLVTDISKAKEALEKAGRSPTVQPALALEVPDKAGGLASILESIKGAELSINDLFTFVSRLEGKAVAVATFDDTNRAEELLRAQKIMTIDQKALEDHESPKEKGPYLLDDYLGVSFFW